MKSQTKDHEEVLRRMDIIIKLILKAQPGIVDEKTLGAWMQEFSEMGLSPKEIAFILDKTPENVRAQLSQLRKRKKGKN